MQNMAVNLAGDLSHTARTAIEDILGRALREDEQISVMAFRPHAAPTGKDRCVSAAHLKTAMDDLAAKALPVEQREFEDAINEDLDHVRPARA